VFSIQKALIMDMERKATIYVVDDDSEIFDAISTLAKPTGATLRTFNNAEDFLDYFRYDGPACLISDVRLPGMSGLQLLKKLAQSGCAIPIIIISAYADIRMALDAIKGGAVNFFEKPFSMQEIYKQIEKSLLAEKQSWHRRDVEQNIERKLASLKAGERAVLDLEVEGKTNEEIAKILELSVSGVKACQTKAMKTLRIDSKSELMRFLLSAIRLEAEKNQI
jgi:two-component system response regulator FixJ